MIPYSGRRSSEASGATLLCRRGQAAHVSSRPPLPRSHRAGPAQQVRPNLVRRPGFRRRVCLLIFTPYLHSVVGVPRSGRLQFHALRDGAVLEVSPERDHVVDNVAQAASDFVLIVSCEELRLRGGRANAAGLKPSSTVLHGSVSGRSEPPLVWVQAMRTDFGRPSSSMRFRTATPTFISVA